MFAQRFLIPTVQYIGSIITIIPTQDTDYLLRLENFHQVKQSHLIGTQLIRLNILIYYIY